MSLSKLYDDVPIGVCVIKRDRKDLPVIYANPVFVQTLGYGYLNEIIGRPFEDAWPEKTNLVEEAKVLLMSHQKFLNGSCYPLD